ncbi:MAG: DUF1559 domain-containing protein [Planctomycetaceae bacterium]
MSLVVGCACGQKFSVGEEYRGQQLPCPSCNRPIHIPAAAQRPAQPQANRPAQQRQPAAAQTPAGGIEIPVTCLCGSSYAAPPSYAGQSLPCPACGRGIQVPMGGAAVGGMPLANDPFALGPAAADPFRDPLAMPAAAPVGLGAAPAPKPAEGMNPLVLWGAIGGGGVLLAIGLIVVLVVSMSGNSKVEVANGPGQTPVASGGPVAAAPVANGATPVVGGSPVVVPPPVSGGAPAGVVPSNTVASANPTATKPGAPSEDNPFEEAAKPATSGKPAGGESNPFEEVASASTKPNETKKPASSEEASNPFEEATPMGPSKNTSAKANLSSNDTAARNLLKSAGMLGPLDIEVKLDETMGSVKKWHSSGSNKLYGARGKIKETDPIFFKHSWMCELLPHLGHQKVYDKLLFDKPVVEKESILNGRNEIREFLNPMDDRKRADVTFGEMSLTHFVGMAGVEDQRTILAANLPRSDPRAGIFGYDEVVPVDKIKDGASQTIMMIGSGELAGPWIMAGGSTIRGARPPAFDKTTGFGTKGLKKPGAIVVMADGSVRQIPADIDPKVFEAMCTVGGSEKFDLK